MISQSLPANTAKKNLIRCLLLACLLTMNSAFAQVPVISSFAPLSAAPGSAITITGTFNSTAGNNMVFFGGTKGTVTAATSSSLTVTVPQGATHAALQVLNITNGLSAKSTRYFLPTFTPGKPALHKTDFTLSSHLAVGFRAFNVVTADLNEDGKPDFIQTNYINDYNYFAISYNTSTPSNISMAPRQDIIAPGASNFGRPATGDLDGDGKPDIVLPSTGTNEIFVYRNSGNSVNRFSTPGQFATGAVPSSVAIGDIDGDGKNDIVVTHDDGRNLSIFLNTSTGSGNISFAAKSDLTLGVNRSDQVELADLNNDGKPEILFSHLTWHSFFYIKNNSTPNSINFDSGVEVEIANTTGNNISQISLGDIDGDGKIDLAMSTDNSTSPHVAIFRNTSPDGGGIVFDAKKEIPLPMRQSSLALGDLNGDGKPDLMVGYSTSFGETPQFRFGLLQNTSVGSTIDFTVVSAFEAQRFPEQSVIVDIDGDGRSDVISTNLNTSTWSIYRNSLQFPPEITSFSPVNAIPGSTITITGTGFNTLPANNVVFFGATKATVTTASATSLTVTVPAGATYSPISVLNTFNSLTGYSSGQFLPGFSPNKADLELTDLTLQGDIPAGGSSLYGLVSGDLNGDNKPDLVGTDNSGNNLRIYPNSTTGSTVSFATPLTVDFTSFPDPRFPAIGDLDGDGKPDIAVPSWAGNQVAILRNTGVSAALSFAAPVGIAMPNQTSGAAIADIDGDGRAEVVTVSFAGIMSVLRNTSTGPGSISFAAKEDFDILGNAYSIQIADLDGDSKPDVIIPSWSPIPHSNRLVVFKNTSTAGIISFAARQDIWASGGVWSTAIGDLNGDNKPEILVSNSLTTDNGFSVFQNTSSGSISFGTPVNFSTGRAQKSVSIGDINGDGKPDVVVSNIDPKTTGQDDYYLSVFTNNSAGGTDPVTFAPRIDLPASNSIPHVNILADFNSDGRPDILSANWANHNITIYRNTLIAKPITQTSALAFTRQSVTSSQLSWTNGSGQKRAVFIKEDQTGSPAPVDGTDYTANAQFETGSQIGTSGWYCVYNGTGSSVTVTGLSSLSTYRAMVVELNDNSLSNVVKYQTASTTGNLFNFIPASSITSISRMDGNPTNATTVQYKVVLSQEVTGLSASNFNLNTSGITTASITAISGSGKTYTVTVNTGSGDGTLTLRLASDTGLDRFFTTVLPFAGEIYDVDKSSPVLSTVSIASDNTNTAHAKTGDIVTLSITAEESISTPTVTIAGQAATVSGSADTWTASYTMVSTDTEGNVPLNITFSDLAGNAGTAVTATTDGSSVGFDKTAPTLSAVSIASNNVLSNRAKSGDVITVSITASQSISTPTVTIAGQTATVSGAADTWTASYTMTSTDAEGNVPFNIAFTDLAGNAGAAVTETSNGSSVNFDKTNPALSSVSILSDNTITGRAKVGDLITVLINASETISMPAVTVAGQTAAATGSTDTWTATYTMVSTDTEGNVPINITFSDLAGNVGTAVSATTDGSSINFDKTAPTLSLVSIASNNALPVRAKAGDVITVSINASEPVSAPALMISGQTATVSGSADTWTASYTMTSTDTEGNVPFNIVFTDLAGNAGTAVTETSNSSSVTFDKTIPALSSVSILSDNTITGKAKVGDLITLSVTAEESISAPAVTIAGQTATVSGSADTWTASYTMTSTDTEGNVPFNIAFTDLAGNEGTAVTETSNSSSVTFDKTIPALSSVSILSDNTITGKAKAGDVITLSISANETINAPLVTIAGKAATVSGAADTWTASYTMTSADAEGNVPFNIAFTDLSNNPGDVTTATSNNTIVDFDRTGPGLSLVSLSSNNNDPGLAFPDNTVTLNFTATETIQTPVVTIGGHIATVSNAGAYNWKATHVISSASPAGNLSFSISVVDLAGNSGSSVTTTDNSLVRVEHKSAIATLSGIELDKSSLAPAFDPSVSHYSIAVGVDNTIILKPIATDRSASVRINGSILPADASRRMDLTEGLNEVTIKVTSPNGLAARTYTLSIKRDGPANQTPTIDAIADLNVCPFTTIQTIPLSGIGPGPETGQLTTLSISSTNPDLFNSLNAVPGNGGNATISYSLKNGLSGTAIITVIVKDNGGTENGGVDETKRTFTLTVDAPFITTITNSTSEALSIGLTTNLTASGGLSYSWESADGTINGQNSAVLTVRPTETTTYTVTATNASGCTSKASITVNVADDGLALDGKNVVTPNGDGRNDRFIIENIDMYPNNRLVIFDRAGREIYTKNGYRNEWEGTFQGKPLSEGTYYYIVYLKEGLRPLKGYISIVN